MRAMKCLEKETGIRRRGRLIATAFLASAAAWFSGPAWAANATDLTIAYSIIPQAEVSVSRTNQTTHIAVHVSMQNTSTNTINQVLVKSSSSVSVDAPAVSVPASYDSVVSIGGVNPTCSASTSGSLTSVTCTVGQLKGGDTSNFFVIYKSPLFPTLPTPQQHPSVTIDVSATFSEGNSPNSPTANFPKDPVTATLALITTDTSGIDAGIKTVLADNGTFFTGLTPNVVGPTNQFSTSVNVPTTKGLATPSGKQTVTNNSIAEEFAGTSYACSAQYPTYFCYGLSSTIQVLDAATNQKLFLTGSLAGPHITILLTQDASSLSAKKPIPPIGDVKIFYTPDPDTPPVQIVPDCGGAGPAKDAPCIAGRLDALKGNKGYYQWTIFALDNGRFSN